ncbi:MAG: efflux RND transporter periplasmic adaptor subunit [Acidobacteriota bacterium]
MTGALPAKLAAWGLLAALLAGACSEDEAPAPDPLRPVRTLEARATSSIAPATLAGVARAGIESRLSFRVGGSIERLAVKLGDRVEKGEELARLDPTDYELQVEEAKATLAQARAAVRRAAADYDRVRALYENNNAAKAELDAARASAESATAQVDAGQLRLSLAEQQLGYTALRSPLAGAIAEVAVELNENVQAGTPIVLLASGSSPEVEVAVPENRVGSLSPGQRATVTFDALPGQRFDGRVSEVGISSRGAATFEAVVQLDEAAGGSLRSGMAAEVTFYFEGDGQPILRLPPLAVGEDHGGRFVYLFEDRGDGTGSVRRQPVEVGEVTAEGLEILSGVEEGSRVVTAGVRRLVDGMEVRVLGADAADDAPGDRP